MGYETAPATILVATHCAVCGRPLVDAESVQRGIGPDCAKKYGYGSAAHAPDWNKAADALGDLTDAFPLSPAYDAHATANKLVHAIACQQKGATAGRMVLAIDALGYTKLASRIAYRLGAVVVFPHSDGKSYGSRTPFSQAFIAQVRTIPGRSWEKSTKSWLVPTSCRIQLWQAIRTAFPAGTLVVGAGRVAML